MRHSAARLLAGVVILGAVLGVGSAFWFGASNQARHIVASAGLAVPMAGAMPGLMVTLSLTNTGEAVTFSALSSPDAGITHIMGGELASVVVPGGGTVDFALDGAHIMMMAVSGDLRAGRLIPLQFTLGDGSVLKTQVTVADADPVDHSLHAGMAGMPIEPAPLISLTPLRDSASGPWRITAAVDHFVFDTERVDTEHVPGAGHGHLYLNGVKLGRYCGGEMAIGVLPPGEHTVRLDLNTNLHQPYAVDGKGVSGQTRIVVD
ncbi:MAG: copper chaperone PCu(A)C [Pseudomonadota bacterium]